MLYRDSINSFRKWIKHLIDFILTFAPPGVYIEHSLLISSVVIVLIPIIYKYKCMIEYGLTHWGWDKMTAISQTTLSNACCGMKMVEFRLKFVPRGPINNIPALVQIMAWRRLGDESLSESMMVRLPTHICVTHDMETLSAFLGNPTSWPPTKGN